MQNGARGFESHPHRQNLDGLLFSDKSTVTSAEGITLVATSKVL